MSKTSQKGLLGEVGIQNVLNWWFPDYDDTGIGVDRVRSGGANDVGDLSGVPYVCIECKNHSNPILAPLLDNAEWKASNSGRPIWFLTYKRAGVGVANAAKWNAATTVSGFLSGFQPLINGEPAFDVDDVERFCKETEEDLWVDIGASYPGYDKSPLPWKALIMFRPYMRNVDALKQRDFDAELHDPSERILPIVVHPRANEEPGKWYVSTRVMPMALMMETVGLLPFDPDYYPDDDIQKLKNDGVLSKHRNLIRGYEV